MHIVSWFWQVASKYKQDLRCIFLAIDFFIKVSPKFPKTAFACLTIASKFTQDDNKIDIYMEGLTREELQVCQSLQWDLNCPTLCDFLDITNPLVVHLSRYAPMTPFYITNSLETTAMIITNIASVLEDPEHNTLTQNDESTFFNQLPKLALVAIECENMEVEE